MPPKSLLSVIIIIIMAGLSDEKHNISVRIVDGSVKILLYEQKSTIWYLCDKIQLSNN